MIKCEKGIMELSGDGATLLAELSCIVNGIKSVLDEDFAKEMIPAAVEAGMKYKFVEEKEELAS